MKRGFAMIGLACALAACSPTPQPPAPTASPTAPPPTDAPPSASVDQPPPAAAGEEATVAESWELPGTLGPLTTQAELEARFGKANLREETRDGPEGDGSYPVLVVFPDDPRKRLELVLDADDKDAPIRSLRVSDPGTLWHAANGLRPGMPLAALTALNGAPVSFYGLDWDYGGTVQDWHGGKLANAVGAPVFHAVTLAARGGAEDAKLPTGDAAFRSDDPKWPGIGRDLVVGELSISWPHENEE